jgi:hypothetical protein
VVQVLLMQRLAGSNLRTEERLSPDTAASMQARLQQRVVELLLFLLLL